jgi:hypothetical protein
MCNILVYVHRSEEEMLEQQSKLKEMIFLRDLHFGFLPNDCEDEFDDCFDRIATVKTFYSKTNISVPTFIYDAHIFEPLFIALYLKNG